MIHLLHSHLARLPDALAFILQLRAASTIAKRVDHLFYFLTAFTVFLSLLIFGLIFYFMIKYRRRAEGEVPEEVKVSIPLELTWTLIPAGICVFLFLWSATLYFKDSRPPANSMEIFVVGKQWMWQLQHVNGARELDELHIPVGVPVKLTMTSEDVIHDFFVPAFRVKEDVLPGRYTSIWFQATHTGVYRLECAQYCGMGHSSMTGKVIVMKQDDFARWLAKNAPGLSMSGQGQKLFSQLGCVTCHVNDTSGKYPSLAGVYGHPVELRNGSSVTADEAFVRNVIVHPGQAGIAGYAPSMPSFQGQINEVQLLDLIAYIKTLAPEERQSASR